MVTYHQLIVGCLACAVALTARLLPRSGFGVRPAKVALSKIQHPGVVETLKLLGHIISDMPDCRAVLIVNLAIIPNLKQEKKEDESQLQFHFLLNMDDGWIISKGSPCERREQTVPGLGTFYC